MDHFFTTHPFGLQAFRNARIMSNLSLRSQSWRPMGAAAVLAVLWAMSPPEYALAQGGALGEPARPQSSLKEHL